MNAYYVPGSVLDAGDTKIKDMVPTLKILLPYGEDSQVTNYENIGERDGMLTKFPKGRWTFAVSTPSYSIHFLTLQSGPHPFLILISQCHQDYPPSNLMASSIFIITIFQQLSLFFTHSFSELFCF